MVELLVCPGVQNKSDWVNAAMVEQHKTVFITELYIVQIEVHF